MCRRTDDQRFAAPMTSRREPRRNVADAAEDSRDERFQAIHHAHQRVNFGLSAPSNATRRRQSGAERESEGNHEIRVDAHQFRRVQIEGNRPHRLADFRVENNVLQSNHQENRNDENQNLRSGNRRVTEKRVIFI